MRVITYAAAFARASATFIKNVSTKLIAGSHNLLEVACEKAVRGATVDKGVHLHFITSQCADTP